MKKYPVRTATKAIIIENDHLLVVKHQNDQVYYTLPGGGQNHNEDLRTAMKRECMEELGAEVQVKDILMVRDYISDNHVRKKPPTGFHQIDIIFECELLSEVDLDQATEQDPNQVGTEWIPLPSLDQVPLFPRQIRTTIQDICAGRQIPIYQGDIA